MSFSTNEPLASRQEITFNRALGTREVPAYNAAQAALLMFMWFIAISSL